MQARVLRDRLFISSHLSSWQGAKYSRFVSCLMLVSCLLTSCYTYRTFEIEVFNPAAVTFPPNINTLMIVNNAAQQPDNIGHKLKGYINKDIKVSADSTAYDLCMSLGKSISQAQIFDDVRMCEDTIRYDSVFYKTKFFSKEELSQMCSDYDVDAVITLDKLIFNTNLTNDVGNYGFYLGSSIEVEASGELHVYWPGEKEVFAFPFRDSVVWYDENITFSDMFSPKDVHKAMRYTSNYLGEKLNVNFAPYWSVEERWYYKSIFSEWKQASVLAASDKWAEAENVWNALLQKNKNRKQQAQLYSNLALCAEIKGDFNKAIEYAEKSCELFKSIESEDSQIIKAQKRYSEMLKKRLINEELLSKQLKEK